MTREKAIVLIERAANELREMMKTITMPTSAAEQLQQEIDAHEIAISALRQQECVDDVNKSLTMDELRQMDEASEPVYLYIFDSDIDSGWQIIEQITDRKIIFRGKTNTYVPIKELGVSYNLYRQKPEEDDHEN